MSLLGKSMLGAGLVGKGSSVSTPASSGSTSYLWGMGSLAGEMVSPSTAAQVAALFCGLKIISETIGMISLDMYEKRGDSIHALPKHPLQFRLHDEPNDDQTAMEWRMQNTGALVLWGNTYNKKITRGSRLSALKFIAPQTISQQYPRDGRRSYRVFPLDGIHTPEDLSPDQVLHPKTISLGGSPFEGTSPISLCRNAVGLAMALEKHSSRFFANGAIPGGLLTYPGDVSDELQRNIRESWARLHQGSDNAYNIGIIPQDGKYQTIASDPDKTQLVEVKKFQVLEMCRILRIPPHMMYEMSTGSGSNSIEQQSIEFVRYTLRPWIKIWEQSLNRSLLSPEEKGTVFCAFDTWDLEYGDLNSRFDAYSKGVNWGFMSDNDVRKREGWNPREDPDGDAYLNPMNMQAFGEGITSRTMSQGPGKTGTPATGAGPNSSTVPTVPIKPATKREREIFEVAQDVIERTKELGKNIEKMLEAA